MQFFAPPFFSNKSLLFVCFKISWVFSRSSASYLRNQVLYQMCCSQYNASVKRTQFIEYYGTRDKLNVRNEGKRSYFSAWHQRHMNLSSLFTPLSRFAVVSSHLCETWHCWQYYFLITSSNEYCKAAVTQILHRIEKKNSVPFEHLKMRQRSHFHSTNTE